MAGCSPSRGSSQLPSTPGSRPTSVPPAHFDLEKLLDNTGHLIEDVDLVSGDGLAVLHLPQGGRILDGNQEPVSSLTILVRAPKAEMSYTILSSPTFDIEPRGARLDPPGILTLNYNAAFDFRGIDPNSPQIGASWGESVYDWIPLEVETDLENFKVSARIEYLGSYIAFFYLALIS